eukprot:2641810-Pyramimonas_sp.AAC.1
MIGRVYTVHPSAGELYCYLRMLLHHVTGLQMSLPDASEADRFRFACTIEALLKFYGDNVSIEPLPNAACGARRGLLQDDNEWHEAMSCASFTEMPTALRELCGYILMYNHPSDPQHLIGGYVLAPNGRGCGIPGEDGTAATATTTSSNRRCCSQHYTRQHDGRRRRSPQYSPTDAGGPHSHCSAGDDTIRLEYRLQRG